MIFRSGMMATRLEAGTYLLYKKGMCLSEDTERRSDRRKDKFSRRKLERMSDQKLRKKLLKKLVKRKLSQSPGEHGMIYESELIHEASRRGIQTGLPAPVPVKEDDKQEKQKPDTYETAREHIKTEEFEPAVRILWKLRCNRKTGETESKARQEGDSFTLATLRFFDAAEADTFDSYLRAFCVVDSLNSGQAQAFYKQVVARKREFSSWERSMLADEEEQVRLCPLRDDLADARMKRHSFTRKRKMLDSALAEAECIGESFSKSEALKEVALAFAQSGHKKEALDIFKKAEGALPEKRDSDKGMYDYLMALKKLGSAMAKGGLSDHAYSLFRRAAESASPIRSYQYDDDGTGAIALIEIGLAQWEAGVSCAEVEKTFRDVHNVLICLMHSNPHFALNIRKKRAAAYAKMDLSNEDLANKAKEEFEKVANSLFKYLSKSAIGNGGHSCFLENLVSLVSALAEADMTAKASEYFERGIDCHGLGMFNILLAKGYVAIGAAQLRANSIDSAKKHFDHAMHYMEEDSPSLQSVDMLTQMGLAYAKAGFDLMARRKFEEAAIEADKLPLVKSSIADVQRISTYIQAAKNDGFLSGIDRRSMYEALCVHAGNIKLTYYSVNAFIAIAAAQRKDGKYKHARATLKIAQERIDSGDEKYKVKELAWHHLAKAYADLGDLDEARKIASKLNFKKLFSKASAAIVIARARHAARIDAEPLTEEEARKIMYSGEFRNSREMVLNPFRGPLAPFSFRRDMKANI